MLPAPFVIIRAPGFHRLKAFTGPADQWRQDSQWQKPIATGSPLTKNSTAPQKHFPLCSLIGTSFLFVDYRSSLAPMPRASNLARHCPDDCRFTSGSLP
jgi:hypothetical protein